jgi:uncharacterized protein YjbI with pentapeptide repeats
LGEDQVTITLPMSGHALGVLVTVLGVAALSAVVFWITGKGEPKDWLSTLRERMGLTGLHPALVVFFILVWVALFFTLLTGIFWVLVAIGEKVSVSSEEEGRDLRWYLLTFTAVIAAFGAVIALPFTLIKTALNRRQTETAEQGLITDRINKAVEGLGASKQTKRIHETPRFRKSKGEWMYDKNGNPLPALRPDGQKIIEREVLELSEPNLEVRIGAIYALERISQDSTRDHIQIMEILCAYIRQNAGREDVPLPEGDPTPEEWKSWAKEGREHPRLDVDVALKVIERRSEARKQLERDNGYRLGLERAPLHKIILSKRDLTGADLRGANLQGANLRLVGLKGADLMAAKLQGGNLRSAQLQGVVLMGAQLQGVDLIGAQLQGANLSVAQLKGADLRYLGFDKHTGLNRAALQGAAIGLLDCTELLQFSEHLPQMFGDASVTLPGGHGPEHESWPKHWPKFKLEYAHFQSEWRKWQDNPDNYTPPDPPGPNT